MASCSKFPKQPKIPETTEDMISSMPTEVTDKIMKRLPLKMAAKMSVLSRRWRRNWLSHRYLVFDKAFCEEHHKNGKVDLHKINNIISNILFLHNGPMQVFHLYIPQESDNNISHNLSPWLFFLSIVGVKKICIPNWSNLLTIPSHIYACKELVKLRMEYYVVGIPPCEFKGFAHLRNLELVDVEFKHGTLKSLIASCPQLKVLVLENSSTGMNNVVIDAPRLEALTIRCAFKSLALENVPCVKSVIVCLHQTGEDSSNIETVDAIKVLASSTELQCLQFEGQMCKLDSIKSGVKHKFDYNEDYKLGHLLKVRITGITGSSAEFKLIEYVLATSVVLEKLFFNCACLDPSSELKVSRELLQLPRASPKAKLVCLEQ
ncbi:F-box/FBD/LRR-repeat protein At1g13570-like [Beta vulgaris subsp. vulgaris]|uniref:F-box/FBD/LRR-repeat protein At1g13570-like n=1 Tax=Beta vulgaris subsp. vulgaris TaxID=3555 RepID=UPI00203767CA|nr:F-box/FBD/LRR-repeat protein At1g13570-like [Beta vulgaris subsp. vulgaris]